MTLTDSLPYSVDLDGIERHLLFTALEEYAKKREKKRYQNLANKARYLLWMFKRQHKKPDAE